MSDVGGDPIFKGHTPGGMTCEDFVQVVRRHAIVEKRSRDNEYIADYAMSWFTDDALHWSETLSEEVQGDWLLLRKALLAEYGSSTRRSGSAVPSLPSAIISVSAAAPSPAQASDATDLNVCSQSPTGFTIGRIRVQLDSARDYLEMTDEAHSRCLATLNVANAATFEVIEADGGIELRFTSPESRRGSWLGVIWDLNPIQPGSYAALLPVERRGSNVYVPNAMVPSGWSGPAGVVKWTRSESNSLSPIIDIYGATRPRVLSTVSSSARIGEGRRWLDITNDLGEFRRRHGWLWKEVRFVFERP